MRKMKMKKKYMGKMKKRRADAPKRKYRFIKRIPAMKTNKKKRTVRSRVRSDVVEFLVFCLDQWTPRWHSNTLVWGKAVPLPSPPRRNDPSGVSNHSKPTNGVVPASSH